MYLFRRQLLVRGDPRKTLPWAQDMAALVSVKTALPVSLWSATLGAPIGSLVFSTFVESRVALAAATRGLVDDPEYLDLAVAGQQYVVAAPEDTLLGIVHNAGDEYQPAAVGAMVTSTSAVISAGKYGAATRWSIEVADLVAEITGLPVLFGTHVGGTIGRVEWVQSAPDVAAHEAAGQQMNNDRRYLAKIDEISGLFVEGSGQVLLGQRLA